GRIRFWGRDQRPDAFVLDVLNIVEIDTDERITSLVLFDADDIDAAFEELETRYLAGEAAVYADMWSVVTHAYKALNTQELPPTMSDWVTVDHRVRETFRADDLNSYVRSGWDVAPDVKVYIEVVHRLSDLGAVATHLAYGTTQSGFVAEWRMV